MDTPPHDWAKLDLKEWHVTAATQAPEKALEFVTVIRMDNIIAPATLAEKESDIVLSIDLPEETAHVVLKKDRFQVQYTDIDSWWEDKDL